MGSWTSPLAFLELSDGEGEELGRLVILPNAPLAEEFIGLFRASARRESAASFVGASVLAVRPHSFVALGKAGPGQPLRPPEVDEDASSCALLPAEAGGEAGAVVGFREGPEDGIQLCFSLRACACLAHGGWRYAARLFKGTEILSQIAGSAGAKRGGRWAVTECGVVEAGERLGGPTGVDLDVYPDALADMEGLIRWTDVDAVVAAAGAVKASASLLFRTERYEAALFRYAKALRFLNQAAESGAGEGREAAGKLLALTLPCILASATCKLRLRRFAAALEDCNEALELAPQNAKVFYRRGQALHGKLEYEAALADLQTALRLNPASQPVKAEIAAVQGAIAVTKSDAASSHAS